MKNFRKSALFVIVSLALSACYKHLPEEVESVTDGRAKVMMTFSLETSDMNAPATDEPGVAEAQACEAEQSFRVEMNEKQPLTRAELNPVTKEDLLAGLWVLQFDNSDKKLILKEYYEASSIQNNKLSVALSDAASTTVYFVGNVSAGQFNSLKVGSALLSQFESLLLTYSSEAAVTNSNASLPMVGTYTGATTATTADVKLKRLAAKIVFTCKVDLPANESFALKTIQLRSVPNVSSYKSQTIPTSTSPVYPAADAGNFMDYYAEYPQTGNATEMKNTGVTLIWYLPENLRGVKKGLTEAQKGEANAPAYSTYIEVKGTYTQGAESFDVAYRVYPGANAANDFNVIRNYKYTITLTIKGANPGDRVVVNKTTDDLSANGTSNCYIVSKAGRQYKFRVDVVGNGVPIPQEAYGSQTPISHGIILGDVTNPFVVWETGSQGSVIVPGSVKVQDGYLYFTTAGKTGTIVNEGNAVVAVRYSNGNVAWSWHIWATRYDPDQDYDTYYTYPLSPRVTGKYNLAATPSYHYAVMKYNLGADATAAEGSIGLHGLLYQWGRKDPFIGPRTYASTGTDFAPTTNAAGHEWKTILNTTAIASIGQNTNAELWYTWAHPTHFLRSNGIKTKDWAARADEYKYQHDNLWGNYSTDPKAYPNQSFGKKTLHDPCPPGWRVPPADLWTNFIDINTAQVVGQGALTGPVNANGSYNNGWRFYYYYGKKDRYAFYPYIITRSPIDGQFTTGNSGFYWSSSVFVAGHYTAAAMGLYAVNKAYGAPLADGHRGQANAVRCIREMRW